MLNFITNGGVKNWYFEELGINWECNSTICSASCIVV